MQSVIEAARELGQTPLFARRLAVGDKAPLRPAEADA
jgi:hypothetical protein